MIWKIKKTLAFKNVIKDLRIVELVTEPVVKSVIIKLIIILMIMEIA
jgi:hypothetical protein